MNSQTANSYKSTYRRIPGGRDLGQRFVVEYRDGLGAKRQYGFTDDLGEAERWLVKVDKNPVFSRGAILDRGEK